MMTHLLPMLLAAAPLQTVFPQRALVSVESDGTGFSRLALPAGVLREVQSDLSDVRLLDGEGRVVPYLVQRHEAALEVKRVEVLAPTNAQRTETPGDKGAPAAYDERYTYPLPKDVSGAVTFEVRSALGNFIRSAQLEVLGDKGAVLARAEGTVFRLRDNGAERLTLALPAVPEKATGLRLSLKGLGDGYLGVTLVARTSERLGETATLRWPVEGTQRREGTTTVYTVKRPSGFVPTRLELATTTPWFNRLVQVSGDETELASGRLLRLPGTPALELLALDVRPSEADTLRIVIDDGDSPPLEAAALTWLVEQPELVFTPPGGALWLYFGGHRTAAPRFDTDAFSLRRFASPLRDGQRPSTLGPVEKNPDLVKGSPVTPFQVAGSPVTVSAFPHQAKLSGWGADAEVVSLRFDAAHVATMASDFRDLRVVDAQGRQWPYLLNPGTDTTVVALGAPVTEKGESSYRFTVGGNVVSMTLVPKAGAPYFSRPARLSYLAEGPSKAPQQVTREQLTFEAAQRAEASRLTFRVLPPPRPPAEWILTIEDGADAPLENLSMQVEVSAPTVLTLAPAGEYRALWGQEHATAPVYDLTRARDVLLQMRVTPGTVGPVEANAQYVQPSLIDRTGGTGRWAFWASLVVAVLVLGALGLKVARQQEPGPPPA
ncbi:MAG: DUF3999 domain-containing protein [Myxococcaceae bacterium]|nr:DUF3999 domain-containing protein [Myxococcaceae bacterium]